MSKSPKQLQQDRMSPSGIGGVETKRTALPKPKTIGSVGAVRADELHADLTNGVGATETSGLNYDAAAKKIGLSKSYQ